MTVIHRRMVGADTALCGVPVKRDATGSDIGCSRCVRSERVFAKRIAREVRRLTRKLNRTLGNDGEAQLVIDRLPSGEHRTALDVELERAGLVPLAS